MSFWIRAPLDPQYLQENQNQVSQQMTGLLEQIMFSLEQEAAAHFLPLYSTIPAEEK